MYTKCFIEIQKTVFCIPNIYFQIQILSVSGYILSSDVKEQSKKKTEEEVAKPAPKVYLVLLNYFL